MFISDDTQTWKNVVLISDPKMSLQDEYWSLGNPPLRPDDEFKALAVRGKKIFT